MRRFPLLIWLQRALSSSENHVARIAILGLGYIGGSIGLGLKQAKLKNTEIIGYDDWRRARREAEKRDAVDSAVGSVRDAVDGAGLVVVATPPSAAEDMFEQMAPQLGRGAAVTDVSASKRVIHAAAAAHLPSGVSFVGGHPMAGDAATFGIENAKADLFQSARWFVCTTPSATDASVRSVLGMIRELGAEPHFLNPDEHDYLMAAVSHLPLVVSAALFTMLRGSEGWIDFGRGAGDTFKTMTGYNSGDPSLTTEILVTNRTQVQHWIDRLVLELHRLRDVLDGEEEAVFQEFANAQMNYARFLHGDDLERDEHQPEIPDARSQMAALLVSQRLYDRVREMTKRQEERERSFRGRPSRR